MGEKVFFFGSFFVEEGAKFMQKDAILKEAERLAYQYEQNYGGCSQCVVGALKETIDGVGDDVFKAATGLAGGIAVTGSGTCGALTGGAMVLSIYKGREYSNFADPQKTRWECFRVCKKLKEKFDAEYGSGMCKDIQKKLMGGSYNLWDKIEYDAFIAAGGHRDKCPEVCGKAAKWVVEILREEKLLAD
jgi:C_GCAxxG_C_C family probable redox protein